MSDPIMRSSRAYQFIENLPPKSEWALLTTSVLVVVPYDENPYLLDTRHEPPKRINLEPLTVHQYLLRDGGHEGQQRGNGRKATQSPHSFLSQFLSHDFRKGSTQENSSEETASGISESDTTLTTSQPHGQKEPSPEWPASAPGPSRIKPPSNI